jgi:ribonuclease D
MSSSTSVIDTRLIDSAGALLELRGQLLGEPQVGIDTEFLRERTYRAELCLIQMTTRSGPTCLDPLALPDLDTLRPLFCGGPLKVLHAGRQDLEVLLPIVGIVRPLFDTQIAAALAGFPAQVGYAELVRRLLDRDLPKGQTRTDWSRRPLSPEQIEYALDDVRYLLPLREILLEQLQRLQRMSWLEAELAELEDPARLAVDPELAWQRFKGVGNWDAGRLRLLKALAAWRERRAIERNRPRGWILDDAVLREIVQQVPRTHETLARIAELPEGVLRHSGDDLLTLINEAEIEHPAPPLPRRERPDPESVARTRRLTEVVQDLAKELAIAAEILATRRDLEDIARGAAPLKVLGGWRAEVLADRLQAAL